MRVGYEGQGGEGGGVIGLGLCEDGVNCFGLLMNEIYY